MNKKKKLILDTARALFNEKGYHNVTIRMIALEMNMSSGNLNYHYQKREDIFEALYFEMVSEFDERLKDLPNIEISITQIKLDIEKSMKRMINYTFFWTDLYNLLNVSDKVKEHFQGVYKKRIEGYFLLFEKMKKQGLLRNSSFELEYHFLAERMINYGNTWLYSTRLYSDTSRTNNVDYQANMLLVMLFPFLTSQGQKEFQNLLAGFFPNSAE